MSLWSQLLKAFGYTHATSKLSFEVEPDLIQSLHELAEKEERPQEEIAADLLAFAVAQRDEAEVNLQRWRALTPRERQITALVCLNYTNREIAAHLTISPETVKTHLRNAMGKFGLTRKSDLRQALAEWDFSAWDRA
jgi:DNA-binding CsgD family transcriptional regulator